MNGGCDFLGECAALLESMGVERHIVVRMVGEMRRRYGGCEIYVQQIDRANRNEKIRAAIESGQPIKVAAQKAGCHPSTARRIRDEWSL